MNSGPAGFHGHYTTFECAVHGLSDVASLRTIRKSIGKSFDIPRLRTPGPVVTNKPTFFYDQNEKKYAITFMGADASVVRSSHRTLAERGEYDTCAPQYFAFATVPSLLYLVIILVFGFVVQILSSFPWGRTLLLQYPGFFTAGMFSHDGPSKEQLETTSFKMTLYGVGFNGPAETSSGRTYSVDEGPDKKKVVRVVIEGPEPGYVATPMMLITLAECLSEERNSMPVGGVLTPASAFYDSNTIFKRLNDTGIKMTSFKLQR